MKTKITLVLFSLFIAVNGFSIIPNGSIAADWTLSEIPDNCDPNGTWGPSWNLYSELNAGKHAVIDFSAVWCPPCWNYHQSGTLENMWDQYGPDGENTIRVFFIEMDCSTSVECLCGSSGCSSSSGTIGNWATTNFPMFSPSGSTCYNIKSDYSISYYPTVIVVNAENKTLWEVGAASENALKSWLFQSFELKANYEVVPSGCGTSGGVNLTPTGGYGNLSYSWSNGSNAKDLTNATAGTYSVTITDANGYFIVLDDIEVSGGDYEEIEVSGYTQDATCWDSADGEIVIEVSGGSGSYSYEWSNGETTQNISGLSEGTYSLTVTSGACVSEQTYTISQPPELLGSAQTYDASCGQADGTILLEASGGKPPYRFDIGNGYSYNTQYFDVLPGVHNVEVLDDNECEYSFEVEVGNIEGPTADAGDDIFMDCSQTSVQLDGTGSSYQGSNYSYLWTTDDGHIVSGEETLTPIVDKGGTYKLEVTYVDYGCTEYDEVVVADSEGSAPIVSIATPGTIDCNNTTVSIDASASEQNDSYTYQWTTEDGNIVSGANDLIVTVDKGGSYTFKITNNDNGCIGSQTVLVIENVILPQYESFVGGKLDCNNSSVDICVELSTQQGSIEWEVNNANTNCITVDEAGVYVFSILGDNGCVAVDSVEVVADPDSPQVIVEVSGSIGCETASVLLDGSGSTVGDNINYLWTTEDGNIVSGANNSVATVDKGGSYTLKITNNDNGCFSSKTVLVDEDMSLPEYASSVSGILDCNNSSVDVCVEINSQYESIEWSFNNADTNCITVDQAGSYVFTIVGDNGCVAVDSVEVVVDFNLPQALVEVSESISCQTESVLLDGSGSTVGDNIDYLWTTEDGNIVSPVDSLVVTVDKGGSYTLKVTNNDNGCSSSQTVLVFEDMSLPEYASSVSGILDCNNSSVDVCVEINSQYESIEWSLNDADTNCIVVDQAGLYVFTIVGENGCVAVDSVQVTGDANAPYAVIESSGFIGCGVESVVLDGSASTAGDNIVYLWTTENGNIITGNTDNVITVDKPGVYTLSVTNELTGCSNSESVEVIEEIVLPDASFEYNVEYNVVTLYSVGSAGAVSTWTYGDVTQSGDSVAFTFFDNGTYDICHYLENNCGIDTSCQTVEINAILPLSANVSQNDVACFGYNNGSISIEPEGGILEYFVNWTGPNDFTSTAFVLSELYAGEYYYELVDAGNHKKTGTIVLTEPDEISVKINVFNATGANNDGAIDLEVEGGVPPYTYLWDDGAKDEDRTGLGEGDYNFVVTDSNGCTYEDSVKIIKTSLDDIATFVEKFEVFPNPSFNQTSVELKFDEKIEGSLKLVDYTGKVIDVRNISFKSGLVSFDVSNLSSGVYLLKLDSKQKVVVRKLLKL